MSEEHKPKAFARFLSRREAERCENALEPVCKCRCGGRSHGKGRIPQGGDFSALPMDDPHFVPPAKAEIRAKLRRAEDYLLKDYNDADWSGRIRAMNVIADARRRA